MSLSYLSDGDLTSPVVAVLMHGFGSDQHDLAGLGPVLPSGLPWASLRGPNTMEHGGANWFPITTPGLPDPAPIQDATEQIWGWIDENLPAETKIIAIGFSQGGLMASQLLRTRPERIAATGILGGFVGVTEQPADQALTTTKPPVFYGRGDQDQVIPTHATERTEAWLAEHATATVRLYQGLAHGINALEMRDLNEFLAPVLAGASQA